MNFIGQYKSEHKTGVVTRSESGLSQLTYLVTNKTSDSFK